LEAEMGRVIVLMGVSGAGKDTWMEENFPDSPDFSADKFFRYMEEGMEKPEYRFDKSKLGAAHAWCLREYTKALQEMQDLFEGEAKVLIVNNTNTSLAEMAPYCALALAYGHGLQIVALVCAPEVAAKRNVHDTPATVIFRQDARLRRTLAELPSWWPLEIVFTD
jgi:predicted kinase